MQTMGEPGEQAEDERGLRASGRGRPSEGPIWALSLSPPTPLFRPGAFVSSASPLPTRQDTSV